MIAASKYQSYGNDYLVIRESDLTRRRAAALTRDICRRHFGIGGDGCVFVEPGGKDRFRIRIFNPDGSEAAMSGQWMPVRRRLRSPTGAGTGIWT